MRGVCCPFSPPRSSARCRLRRVTRSEVCRGSARACSWAGMSAAARAATMTRTRTAVFVMLSFAGSPRRMTSRQMATVLNRLGGIGAPDVCLGMALGAAKGELPMSEHSQRLCLIPDTKPSMRMSESKSKLLQACDLLQPWRREQRPRLRTVAALAAAALAAAALPSMAPRARGRVKLRGILLATVAAAPVALAERPCRGATRTMVGRLLILITVLSTASGWKLPSYDARDRRRLVASACDADWCAARPARASHPLRDRCLLCPQRNLHRSVLEFLCV